MTVLKYTYNVFQDNGKCLFLANFVADCHKTMRIDSVVVLGKDESILYFIVLCAYHLELHGTPFC